MGRDYTIPCSLPRRRRGPSTPGRNLSRNRGATRSERRAPDGDHVCRWRRAEHVVSLPSRTPWSSRHVGRVHFMTRLIAPAAFATTSSLYRQDVRGSGCGESGLEVEQEPHGSRNGVARH